MRSIIILIFLTSKILLINGLLFGSFHFEFIENILEENKELITEAKQKAIAWVESQRSHNWGWEKETPRIITSLLLANSSWFQRDDLKSLLSVKQMEIQLLSELFSPRNESPIKSSRLAQYLNALLSVCKNPSSFYGHDLISMISNELPPMHTFQLAFIVDAMCKTRRHIQWHQMRKFMVKFECINDLDTSAMIVMALQCLITRHQFFNGFRVHTLLTKKLKQSQREDGSFGNIYTSALVTQALLPISDEDRSWNATNALNYLLSQQTADGSFGDILATSDILPILNGKNFAKVTSGDCHEEVDIPDHVSVSEGKGLINVNYSLWIDGNMTERHTINLTVPAGISFYEMMKFAAEHDERFTFKSQETSFGPYIRSINNIMEKPKNKQYWMLATITDPLEPYTATFTENGVNNLYPDDGDHIVFWYKKI